MNVSKKSQLAPTLYDLQSQWLANFKTSCIDRGAPASLGWLCATVWVSWMVAPYLGWSFSIVVGLAFAALLLVAVLPMAIIHAGPWPAAIKCGRPIH